MSGTYYIKATNQYGCSKIEPVVVVVSPLPYVVINNPAMVCAPETVDLTSQYITMGSDPGLTYTYHTNASATSTLSNPSEVRNSGTYYIKATNPQTGCFVIKPVVVSIVPGPEMIVHDQAACAPATVNLTLPDVTAGSEPGLTYTYHRDELAILTLNNATSISVSGTYYIKGTAESGCIIIKAVNVEISLPSVADFRYAGPYCT